MRGRRTISDRTQQNRRSAPSRVTSVDENLGVVAQLKYTATSVRTLTD
ncbi:MAG: hypothetical protein IKE66_08145 [Hyphomicrobium sp.]|nr:hypothetical protein [Hyphomicrobium sp.]